MASLSAMVAGNETLKLLTEFSSFKYGLSFFNYGEVIANYSVQLGFQMLAIDALIYFAIGCFFEACSILVNIFIARRRNGRLTKLQENADATNMQSTAGDISQKAQIIDGATAILKTGLKVIDVRLGSH